MELDRAERLVAELRRLGATKPCSRCGHPHFEIVAESMLETRDGSQLIPVVLVGCKNCGYLVEHSLGILNMMPEAAHAG